MRIVFWIWTSPGGAPGKSAIRSDFHASGPFLDFLISLQQGPFCVIAPANGLRFAL